MDNSDKKVFIVTPIGGDNTEIRRAAEGVIDAVIIPTLVEEGFKEENISVAHRISTAGSINKQLITRIIEDDLVITNLTKLNPNVMYELAIRHAVRKPVIQICEHGTTLPFDIIDERTIFYTNDMQGVIDLAKGLSKYIVDALQDNKPDNPIYRAIESEAIIKNISPSDINMDKYIMHRLDSIEKVITQQKSNNYKKDRFSQITNPEEYNISVFLVDNSNNSEVKTEVERILDQYNIEYSIHDTFETTNKEKSVSGIRIKIYEEIPKSLIRNIVSKIDNLPGIIIGSHKTHYKSRSFV